MIERHRATIRTLLMVSHGEVLMAARKGVNGLRLQHLFAIMLVGDNQGIRLAQAVTITRRTKDIIYKRLLKGIERGHIRKENKLYYLTEQGQQVYNTIVKESDKAIKEITVLLAAEVRKKLE